MAATAPTADHLMQTPANPAVAPLGARPAVSVVICTFNRPRMLETAIRSCLSNASRASLSFEIVVADNSVDGHAAAIVEQFKSAGVTVRQVAASPPNIAIARNAGVKAARAPLVAFMDDDSEVDPGWLDALAAVMQATGADAAVGPVRAKFAGAPPAWDASGTLFERKLAYPNGAPIDISGPLKPSGFTVGTGNSIWRTDTCFTDLEPFDPAFGAAGGEDYDLFLRIERRGRRVVWCSDAGSDEVVPAQRTEFSNQFLRVFSSAQGYAVANIKNSSHGTRKSVSIMARGAVQSILYAVAVPVIAAIAWFGAPRAATLWKQVALKLAAGLGKALWWRRMNYYQMQQPKQATPQ